MKQDHFEKLDEGEKWIVYRAAFRSLNMVNLLLGMGMAAMVIYSVLFEFRPVPDCGPLCHLDCAHWNLLS